MIQTGPRNLITDVDGITVGQAEDIHARTGVTILLCDASANAAVDVRGGAPGTRETDVLDPCNLVGAVDAIALSGGSVFGLEAAGGAVAVLSGRGRGFRLTPDAPSVPIVSAAVLFDLNNGGDKHWTTPPYAELGRRAAESAQADFALGNAGAGFGAIAGTYKGGVGSASAVTEDGITVGALAAVNAFGSPIMTGSDVFWAWPFEMNDEFGGRRPAADVKSIGSDFPPDTKAALAGANTTIAIVATDADLTRIEAKRLAVMAADGFALALQPAHTPFDGDAVFAVATAKRFVTGERAETVLRLGALAARCMARAVARGVFSAATLGSCHAYRDRFGQ